MQTADSVARRPLVSSYAVTSALHSLRTQHPNCCSVKLNSANLQTLGGLCHALVKSYTDANICRQIRPNIHKPGPQTQTTNV